MIKFTRFCCLIAIVAALPTRSLCENPQLCYLGESVVEEMNLQVSANRKIDPAILMASLTFLERCPFAVVPSFKRYANDKDDLHRTWVTALKSSADVGTGSSLDTFLAAAHQSVIAARNHSLDEFLDGIFDRSATTPEIPHSALDHLLDQQASSILQRIGGCDSAECYALSDFLLFLLGTHPTAFWSAMRSDPDNAKKWLSQLPDLSFAGEPSQARRRESIRKALLKRVSAQGASGFRDEKSQCIRALSRISFRAWN